MKRLFAWALTALVLLAVVPASAVDYLYIATGGTSGTYYALAASWPTCSPRISPTWR